MNIQTIIDKFDKEFVNSEISDIDGKTDYYLNDKANDIVLLKQFLKDSLTSMLDGIEKSIKAKQLGEDDEYEGYAIDCDSWNACRQEVINIINSHR